MNSSFVIRFLLMFSILSACTEQAEKSPYSVYTRNELSFRIHDGMPVYDGNDPNSLFHSNLLPNELQFERVTEGQKVPLNSLIVMPYMGDTGALTIEFRRSDLHEKFVRDFFFGEDMSVVNGHPFASEGIEAKLTDKKLIVNLQQNIVLRLGNGMSSSFPKYETFVSENVKGKITKSIGTVLLSSDQVYVKIKLRNFYVMSLIRGGQRVDTKQ